MLAVSHRSYPAFPPAHYGDMDDSGTINPAALNAPSSTIAPNLLTQPSPRGVKRSRSPDSYGAAQGQEPGAGDVKGNKRSKPLKSGDGVGTSQAMSLALAREVAQTPQVKTQGLPLVSPNQTSPQRSTPGSATKPAVVKALPTVRDHTTDQLGPEGDEYIPRETDADGETKVSKDGYPLDGRKYRCRTFQVPNRGEKLFMLATECARVLGYRDSYLLFNKNRSLYKIIANQQEKDNLIHQEILPYSYRSRQIAIVTARSMFRQFGSRLVEGGRRVRDDYWEAKARKQGFTEEDLAGEKRPGAAKQREAAAAEAHNNTLTSLPQGEIIYSNGPSLDHPPGMHPASLAPAAPLPMIHLASDELRPNSSYGGVIRPRQEVTGPAYHDRIQSNNPAEAIAQSVTAADFNKSLGQTRAHRANYLDEYWRRPHEQPSTQAETTAGDINALAPQQMHTSPHAVAGSSQTRGLQEQMSMSGSQGVPPSYAYPHQQNPIASPGQTMHRPVPPRQLSQMSPTMRMGSAGPQQQTNSYNYGTGWPQASQPPLQQMQQYVQQQHQSPMPPPQMPTQSSMNYSQLGQMGANAYGALNRNIYQNPQQHFNMGAMSSAGQQPGTQGWSTPGSTGDMSQNWPRYG